MSQQTSDQLRQRATIYRRAGQAFEEATFYSRLESSVAGRQLLTVDVHIRFLMKHHVAADVRSASLEGDDIQTCGSGP